MIQKEYWCLIWNMNMQSASSIWSNLLSNATVSIIEIVRNYVRGGEANVYGSSYYWNFRTSFFKQVACLILFRRRWRKRLNPNCKLKRNVWVMKYKFHLQELLIYITIKEWKIDKGKQIIVWTALAKCLFVLIILINNC
jgi:hypothetical protein